MERNVLFGRASSACRFRLHVSPAQIQSRHAEHALLHRPTLIDIHNSEFRGQKAKSVHINYKWSHHYKIHRLAPEWTGFRDAGSGSVFLSCVPTTRTFVERKYGSTPFSNRVSPMTAA
jgi:hypothetical protein